MAVTMKTRACGGISVLRCFTIVLIASTLLKINDAKECDEFYVVREGDTFYSIAEKCDDPFILLSNPHVRDPQDIFPGNILRINPQYDEEYF